MTSQANELAGATALESDLTIDNNSLAQVGEWNFSFGLGYGKRTNPLFDGEDTPLYIIPSISYYDEHLFYDDGVLGYSISLTPNWYVSAITRLNPHAANFSRWHPSNYLIYSSYTNSEEEALAAQKNSLSPQTDEQYSEQPISLSQLAKRHWALDAGVQFNYFADDNLMLQINVLTDISGVYNGLNAQLKLEKSWRVSQLPALSFKLSGSLDWHSGSLANYYYGISERDNPVAIGHYSPGSGFNNTLGMSINYQLSETWRGAMTYRVTTMDDDITYSPMLKEDKSDTFFIGATYDF